MECLLRRCCSYHLLRYYLKENKNVFRRTCSVRYGAAGLPYANRWQCTEKYVGTWLVIY